MNFREVRNITRYESRLISRGNLWRIFVFIAVGIRGKRFRINDIIEETVIHRGVVWKENNGHNCH